MTPRDNESPTPEELRRLAKDVQNNPTEESERQMVAYMGRIMAFMYENMVTQQECDRRHSTWDFRSIALLSSTAIAAISAITAALLVVVKVMPL